MMKKLSFFSLDGGVMNQQIPAFDVTSDDKLWAALDYAIPVLVPIIVMLMADKKDRPFIKAHNMQALILGIIYYIVGGILSPFTCALSIFILWIGMLYLAYLAYQGKTFEVPVITNFIRQQGW
jgi:uncharacterized protein